MPENKTAKQAFSLDDITEAVRRAITPPGTPFDKPTAWVREVFPDYAIVQELDGTLNAYPYTLADDGGVLKATLGQPTKVEEKYVPVTLSIKPPVQGRIAQGTAPGKFEVVIIREGFARGDMDGGPFMVDGRPLYWTRQGIESGIEVYAGAAVTAFRLGDEFNHLPGDLDGLKVKAALNEVGRLSNVRVEQAADGLHELRATLTLHEGTPPLVASVLQAWADESIPLAHRGGFSIDARAEFLPGLIEGKAVTQGVRILPNPHGSSVDLVSHPAAGGQVIRRIAASIRGNTPKESSMADPAKTPDAPVAADAADVARIKQETQDALAAAEKARAEIEAAAKETRIERTSAKVRQAVEAAKLPEAAAALVTDAFAGAESFDADAVKAKVEKVTQALGLDKPVVLGSGIQMGLEKFDKIELALEALIVPSNAAPHLQKDVDGEPLNKRIRQSGIDRPYSFLRLFQDATGQRFEDGFRGNKAIVNRVKQAILSTSFDDAMANVNGRLLIRSFEDPNQQDWRRLATIGSVPNFVAVDRIAIGGYANAPTVSENQNYTAATSPTDEGQGFTALKYGFTDSITQEAFLRDDVGALRRIALNMGAAMGRTLNEFAFDRVAPACTDTMDYDGETLCDTDHDINNNKGTTALAAAELIVAWTAMRKFRDISVNKRMGVTPRYLLVPIDLADTAQTILKPLSDFAPGEATDQSFVRSFGLQTIVVNHWTDATDWALIADPSLHPWFEIAFVQGMESPQFFIQDNATLGSLFDRDAITYKVKHAWGGRVLRHEFIYGEVVA